MIYRGKWRVFVTRHAHNRALMRGITPDILNAVVKNGKIKEFGKNYIKFISKYKFGYVICVGEKKPENQIDLITIEVRSLWNH